MTRWISSTGQPEWEALFTGFARSAYRLEGQQVYGDAGQDEYVAQFLSGRPVEVDWAWYDRVMREKTRGGRRNVKVRIVVEPPTPYTRMELSVYPHMVQAGEEIRVLAVQMGDWPAGQPHHDYWLFDDRDVWRLHYHENFHFKGAELIDDPAVVAEHLRWRDLALAESVPLDEYLAARSTDREHTTA